MLESHGYILILLSEVHKLLLWDSPLNSTDLATVRMRAKQTERNKIGVQ